MMWVFGTAADGTTALYDADLKGPAAIVIGSEGDGTLPVYPLRRLCGAAVGYRRYPCTIGRPFAKII